MAFLSEDRKADGIIPELSVRENLARHYRIRTMGHRFQETTGELVDRFMQRLGIKAAGAEQKIHALGRQSAEGPSRDGCARTRNFFSSTSRLAVSTLVQRARSAHRRTGGAGARGSHDFIRKSSLKAHSASSSCVTGGQSPNSVASRRTRGNSRHGGRRRSWEAVGG